MKTALAALLLLAPLAVRSQETALPPPPLPDDDALKGAEKAPPPSEASPVMAEKSAAYVPRYHTRDGWFIGFGVGTGGATLYGDGTFATIGDVVGADAKVGALRFEIGATLSDRLLLGLELMGVGTQQETAGSVGRVAVLDADAVFTFFPDADGLFLRFGGGGSLLHVRQAGETDVHKGYNGLVGVGYAFWVGERFNLSVRVDHSRARYEKKSAVETTELWSAAVGFDWY
jgi:hypothetical protein